MGQVARSHTCDLPPGPTLTVRLRRDNSDGGVPLSNRYYTLATTGRSGAKVRIFSQYHKTLARIPSSNAPHYEPWGSRVPAAALQKPIE